MRLLAVALVAAREALRSRLVLVVALALALGLAALAWGATGDGTAPGRLSAILAWSSAWTSIVLSLTAVFLSTTIAQGLRDGRLVPIAVGPLPRAGLVLGWFLGQAAVVAGLVALASVLTWALARGVAHAMPEREQARLAPILAARAIAAPPAPDDGDVPDVARASLEELARAGRLEGLDDDERGRVLLRIEDAVRLRRRSVSTGQVRSWDIDGIDLAPDTRTIAVRLRYSTRVAGDVRLPEGQGPLGVLGLAPPQGGGVEQRGRWPGDVTHEVACPASVLAGSSRCVVDYRLEDRRPVVVVFPDEGVQVLYASGGFGGNVARAGLVLLGRLLALLAVGVAAAALIDGRLAALVVLFVLAVGSSSDFLRESLDLFHPFATLGPLAPLLELTLRGVLAVLPDLTRDDLGDLLAGGEQVPALNVARSLLVDALLRGGGTLVTGALLFGRRELGAVR